MSRTETLNALDAGINRQRSKGGAKPGCLYALDNGYVTLAGTIESRPGTQQDAALPTGTKGLCAFDGALVVFSNAAKTVPAGYTCEVVTHPTVPAQELLYIHFAAPFLGALYVVAQFADNSVFHYWLQHYGAWQANTTYDAGDVIEPTVPNGFAYRAHRIGSPAIVWAPNVARTVGDVIEPTSPNGYEYTATATLGSNPRSGAIEPTWPKTEGATINEDTDLTVPGAPTTGTTTTPTTTLPPDTVTRYGGLGSGFGGLSK